MTDREQSTDVTGAMFDGADLRGADLRDAVGLTLQQVSRAIIDDTTRLPDQLARAVDSR